MSSLQITVLLLYFTYYNTYFILYFYKIYHSQFYIKFSDIKPENIMCQTKHSTNVKLIDFGLATKLDPNEVVKISTGTAEFAAPEIVEREPVGFYTDMWACGVLAYVL